MLPAKVKTWQFSANNAVPLASGETLVTHCQKVLWGIKNAMVTMASNPWTVVSSSNSITSGSSDLWVSPANLIWNSAGSAHSWIVLKQTGVAANYQVLLACSATSANNSQLMSVHVSNSVGFTGGTHLVDPTASDVIALLTGQQWIYGTTPVGVSYHVMQSTDGQITRALVTGSSFLTTFWNFEKVASPSTGWASPTANLAVAAAAVGTNTGTYSALNDNAPTSFRHGATNYGAYMTSEGYISASNGENSPYFPNDIGGEFPFSPIGIVSVTSGARGRHGNLTDLYWGSTAMAAGTTFPSDGTRQWVQVAHLIFPWSGAIPSLNE